MTLIIGERYAPMLESALSRYGADVLWLPDDPDVDPRLAGHADLCVFYPGGGAVFAAPGVYDLLVNYLTNRGYAVLRSAGQGQRYPRDAGLCVCTTGEYTIYNSKTIDPALLGQLAGGRIDVPQGYTKCSVCVVASDAIITADDVIASRAASAGMDVLKIAPGYILLDGFDYGFIGGASFKLDADTLAFTGTLDAHPDQAAIAAFLKKHGLRAVYLTDGPLFDIGGAVALP